MSAPYTRMMAGLPKKLRKAEQDLLAVARDGGELNLRVGDQKKDDPANGAVWPKSRTIRAEVIYHLLVDRPNNRKVHAKGVRLTGARVEGQLDFESARLDRPLFLIGCHFESPIILQDAKTGPISFAKSHFPGLHGDRVFVGGPLDLKKVVSTGEVLLPGAQIGDLICGGGSIKNSNGRALNATGATFKGGVFLNEKFEAQGEVRLLGAQIGGQLSCGSGRFKNSEGNALDASGATIKGSLILNGNFEARGEVRLIGAKIGGQLNCNDGSFKNTNGNALIADEATITGGVFLKKQFEAIGEVRLLGAEIGGQLSCKGGRFINPKGKALSVDRATIKGSVFLNEKFEARGEVRLLGAEIGGQLSCKGGSFKNPEGDALSADRATIKGDVFLDEKFEAHGEVRLLGAQIGGHLSCSGGSFKNLEGDALSADRVTIKGSVFLDEKFGAQGEVRLLGAQIGGQLSCSGGSFKNPEGDALSADGATIKGDVFLAGCFEAVGPDSSAVRLVGLKVEGQLSFSGGLFKNVEGLSIDIQDATILAALFWNPKAPPVGRVNLQHARCAVLNDDLGRYSDNGNLLLDGFHYDSLSPTADKSSEGRLAWLRKQWRSSGEFPRQPYEHLARVLRAEGRSSDARAISIALQDDLRRSGILSYRAWFWNWLLGVTIGHGWAPWRVFPIIAIFLFLGLAFFYGAIANGSMRPAKERAFMSDDYVKCGKLPKHYPDFNALMYSIDVFVPIVDLGQESYWLPRYSKEHGWIYVIYMWFHIAFGWILTTLGVVGLTGIVKKE